MRLSFIALRFAAYGVILAAVVKTPSVAVWTWLLLSSAWSTFDHLKRPDDSVVRIRWGVWLEFVLILISTCLLRQPAFLFLLASPVARANVHLRAVDGMITMSAAIAGVLAIRWLTPGPMWMMLAESACIVVIGAYGLVMGRLLKQRDRLQKALSLSVFEQEQHARDEERLYMSARLHDVMGQHWTGVIRALDVASAAEGELQRTFLAHARDAAEQGLTEMRSAVHAWNEGRQSAAEWMAWLEQSIARLRELTAVMIELEIADMPWRQLAHSERVAEVMARVTVEAITNAIRHGQARQIFVCMAADRAGGGVRIMDDGTGFPAHTGDRDLSGMGLGSMRQLAAWVHGNVSIGSTASGTEVRLTVPWADACAQTAMEGGVRG